MSKTLDAIRALPWVQGVDDERPESSIIVTLVQRYEFCDEPGCGVRGFDTVARARQDTRRSAVQLSDAADAKEGV